MRSTQRQRCLACSSKHSRTGVSCFVSFISLLVLHALCVMASSNLGAKGDRQPVETDSGATELEHPWTTRVRDILATCHSTARMLRTRHPRFPCTSSTSIPHPAIGQMDLWSRHVDCPGFRVRRPLHATIRMNIQSGREMIIPSPLHLRVKLCQRCQLGWRRALSSTLRHPILRLFRLRLGDGDLYFPCFWDGWTRLRPSPVLVMAAPRSPSFASSLQTSSLQSTPSRAVA